MKKTIIGILAALFTVSLLTVTAFADNEKGVVTADVLNVRSQPQIADNVVGSLYNGQTVDILAADGNWYKIDYNSIPAYVHSDYILLRTSYLTSRDGNGAEKRGTLGEEVVEQVVYQQRDLLRAAGKRPWLVDKRQSARDRTKARRPFS